LGCADCVGLAALKTLGLSPLSVPGKFSLAFSFLRVLSFHPLGFLSALVAPFWGLLVLGSVLVLAGAVQFLPANDMAKDALISDFHGGQRSGAAPRTFWQP